VIEFELLLYILRASPYFFLFSLMKRVHTDRSKQNKTKHGLNKCLSHRSVRPFKYCHGPDPFNYKPTSI